MYSEEGGPDKLVATILAPRLGAMPETRYRYIQQYNYYSINILLLLVQTALHFRGYGCYLHLQEGLQHEKTEFSRSGAELDDVQRLRGVERHAVFPPHTVAQETIEYVRVRASDKGVARDEVRHDALRRSGYNVAARGKLAMNSNRDERTRLKTRPRAPWERALV